MLRPHQRRTDPKRRGKRVIAREHQNHPVRDQTRAVKKEIEKGKRRPPVRRHREP